MRPSTIVLIALTLGASVLEQKVSVEYSHQTDFSKLNTYRWGRNKGQLLDFVQDQHIKKPLDRVLQEKGLHRVDSGAAGMVVTYQATMKAWQKVDSYVDDADIGLGLGWGWGPGWGMGWGDMIPDYSADTVAYINQGDLLVDIADPVNKRMLFRGYSTGAFRVDPVKEDKLLSSAIEKMFEKFPPKPREPRMN